MRQRPGQADLDLGVDLDMVSRVADPASGSSMDWAYSRGVPFPFTFELRDKGEFGFFLPPGQVRPASEETLSAVLALAEAVLEETKGARLA